MRQDKLQQASKSASLIIVFLGKFKVLTLTLVETSIRFDCMCENRTERFISIYRSRMELFCPFERNPANRY